MAKKELADEEAMARFQNGDAGAFDLLLKRHGAGVLRFVIKMVGAASPEAEDLLQEVFMRVVENRKRAFGV